jgi:hypothetical protein
MFDVSNINRYTVGYVICLVILCVSIGFLVDALNKKKTETDEAKKTKLTGQAVGGGFGVALSLITAIVIGYYHLNDNSTEELTQTQKSFEELLQKDSAEKVLDRIDNRENITVGLCTPLFIDKKTKEQFIKMAEEKSDYEWQNTCKTAATGIMEKMKPGRRV